MKQHTLRIYKSRKVAGQWGWSLIAPNGKKVACSGELYKNKAHAIKMAESIAERFFHAVLKVEEKRVRKPSKPVPLFMAGDAVTINAGGWGRVKAEIIRPSAIGPDMWFCRIAAGKHKGYEGTWDSREITKQNITKA